MNKRQIKKYIQQDDSFFGDLISGERFGYSFDILIPFQKGKKDTLMRVYIIHENTEKPYLNKKNVLYTISNGKIHRSNLYKRTYNEIEENKLQEFVTTYLTQISDYFYGKTDYVDVFN